MRDRTVDAPVHPAPTEHPSLVDEGVHRPFRLPLHILLFCQYFPPEMGAPAARAYEFARRWVRMGHRVTVVCGIPNHPTGVVYDGYAKRLLHTERIEGIDVVRTWVYVTPNAGVLRRSINYVSYAVSALAAAQCARDAHICIATSPQFLAGVAGALFARAARIPFLLEVRDLWPDSIKAVEATGSRLLLGILQRIERALYHAARRIVVVSPAFRSHIAATGIDPARIDLVTNGIDTGLAVRGPRPRTHFTGDLAQAFIVLYAGTHGMAHALDTLVDAARLLAGDRAIRFVFVGEGADKRRVQQYAADCANVTFIDRKPRSVIAEMIAEADACIVPLKRTPLFRTVIPSKMFEIMGAARPIILGVEGTARDLLETAQAGIAVEPQNPAALAEAVRTLRGDPERAAWYGDNGFRHVREMYDLDALAVRYLDIIRTVVERSPHP
jgi:colanic acid biosynthesis glycosyl transferase WcaI